MTYSWYVLAAWETIRRLLERGQTPGNTMPATGGPLQPPPPPPPIIHLCKALVYDRLQMCKTKQKVITGPTSGSLRSAGLEPVIHFASHCRNSARPPGHLLQIS